MKTIKIKVTAHVDKTEIIDVEVEDNATEHEIERQCWIEADIWAQNNLQVNYEAFS